MSFSSRRAALLLAALIALVWARAVLQPSEFYSDDHIFILQSRATWPRAFTMDSYSATGYEGAPPVVYRPLGVMMLVLERGLLGIDAPRLWRLASLGCHLVAALLLMRWLRRLELSPRAAWLAALAWGIAPLHAEAICWPSAQFDVVAGALVLAALGTAARARWYDLFLSSILFTVALLVKESMLAALPALALTAWAGARARSPGPASRPADPAPRPAVAAGSVRGAVGGAEIAAGSTGSAAGGAESAAGWPESAAFHAGATLFVAGALSASYLNLRSAVGVASGLPRAIDVSSLAASLGGAVLRAVGLADIVPVAGPPLHPLVPWEALGIVTGVAVTAGALFRGRDRALAIAALLAVPLPGLLFGQGGVGAVADPDRYFYLASAALPALVALNARAGGRAASRHASRSPRPSGSADPAGTPARPSSSSEPVDAPSDPARPPDLRAPAAWLLVALPLAWMGARAIDEVRWWGTFEATLTRNIELGRDSAYVRYLRAEERALSGRTCDAVEDLRRCIQLVNTPGRRRQCTNLLEQMPPCPGAAAPSTPSVRDAAARP